MEMVNLLCVKYKGKSYCWNPETDQIEEVSTKPVGFGDCTIDITRGFIRALDKKAKDLLCQGAF